MKRGYMKLLVIGVCGRWKEGREKGRGFRVCPILLSFFLFKKTRSSPSKNALLSHLGVTTVSFTIFLIAFDFLRK